MCDLPYHSVPSDVSAAEGPAPYDLPAAVGAAAAEARPGTPRVRGDTTGQAEGQLSPGGSPVTLWAPFGLIYLAFGSMLGSSYDREV